MKSSLQMLASVFTVVTVATSGFGQSGSVICDPPMGAEATCTVTGAPSYVWRLAVMGDYGAGTVPEVFGAPFTGFGTLSDSKNVPLDYLFPWQGPGEQPYDLQGVFCWWEYGYWSGPTFMKLGENYWCYFSFGGGSCFVADTPVLTPHGMKPIGSIQKNQIIVVDAGETDRSTTARGLVQRVVKRTEDTLNVTFGGQVVGVTKDHAFFVKGGSWRAAKTLRKGDLLKSADNHWVEVEQIKEGPRREVVDIQVEAEGFYIGGDSSADSVLVYSGCKIKTNWAEPNTDLRLSGRPVVTPLLLKGD